MLAQNGIALEFTDAALAFISDKGFDPQFGARPVKRVIQKYVLNELSKELLGGKINKDRPITIDSNGAGLVFKNCPKMVGLIYIYVKGSAPKRSRAFFVGPDVLSL